MKKLIITSGIMLMLLMAAGVDLKAQRGMMRMRMDTARMMRPQMRRDSSRIMRPHQRMNMPAGPGWSFYNRPAAPGRFGVRPAPPVFGWGRGFGQGYGRGMMQNRPARGFQGIENIPGLTDKQREEIKDLRSKQQEEMQKFREESSKKMQEMRDTHRKKILDLLNDDQKKFVESRQVW